MATALSAELRRLRQAAGASQQVVADAVGVERATVSQWESGRFPPSVDKLRRLDEHFGAEGALAGLGDAAAAPVRRPAPSESETSLAQVFDVVADRFVRAMIHDPDDAECVGWTQGVGRGRRPSPWSTALAVRTLLLLNRVDVDMRAIARTMGRRQYGGGWSNRELQVPRPDVTAVVLNTLTRIGSGNAADLDAAWDWLSTSFDGPDHRRPFVLSTVLENVTQLRPGHPLVTELVRLLLDTRVDFGGIQVWASNPSAGPERVEPSVAHTARAVVALRAAGALVERPEAEDAIGQGIEWLAADRNDDGITEIMRIDPERHTLDVPVDHFTSAHVVQALVGHGGAYRNRLAGAFETLWASYVPAEGLWAWKQDGRLPIWMSHDAVAALRAAALADFPAPHEPETGERLVHFHGGPPQPPSRPGR